MTNHNPAVLWSRIRRAYRRRLAFWLGRRMCRICSDLPVISFTFDDFPRSALLYGGAVLRERGFAGTYYASAGLMGQTGPTSEIFVPEDLEKLVSHQHELGCHTFDHCDAWDTPPSQFEASILRNRDFFTRKFPGVKLASLSYPINCPRPQTKRRTAKYYECARGGGQTFNAGITDLNYLKAFFLEQSRNNFDAVEHVINVNAHQNGWLIFVTHDVCDLPTRFGCTPRFFERVVDCAGRSGAVVLPVHQAFRRILGQSSLHA